MRYEELIEGKNDPHIFKAIFMAGGPGSGKTYIAKKITSGSGLRMVNIDQFYEHLAKKRNLDFTELTVSDKGRELYHISKELNKKKMDLLINGRIGLVIDGTGRNYDKIARVKQYLESLGYESMLVFVNTPVQVALRRNSNRERSVNPDFVKTAHKHVFQNLGKFQKLFRDNLLIIDNSTEDLDLDYYWKRLRRFLDKPVTNPAAQDWLKSA